MDEWNLNAEEGTLDCPSHGSRYRLDGSVLEGPANRPLASWRAAEEGGRLRLTRL